MGNTVSLEDNDEKIVLLYYNKNKSVSFNTYLLDLLDKNNIQHTPKESTFSVLGRFSEESILKLMKTPEENYMMAASRSCHGFEHIYSQEKSKFILKDVLIKKEMNELLGESISIDLDYCLNNKYKEQYRLNFDQDSEGNALAITCHKKCSVCSLVDCLQFSSNVYREDKTNPEFLNDIIKEEKFYIQSKHLYIKLNSELAKEIKYNYKFRGNLTLSPEFKLEDIEIDKRYFKEKIYINWKISRVNRLYQTLQISPYLPFFKDEHSYKGSIARYYIKSNNLIK